ncbi:hypothetical protein RHGRI_017035 [Rhododendron griersonianum]|uniref:Uncharacterized protein n=1 Tax=Rhododendron griersonianum TaxID=479676 RepID=A0AAV6JWD9_9ERIC|nr:hypothetical protein RHGRI_017035 [Rhododendron griersonianum]
MPGKVDLVGSRSDGGFQQQKLPMRRGGIVELLDSLSVELLDVCPYCYNLYENCQKAFQGVTIPTLPPLVTGREAYHCCWSFFPVPSAIANSQGMKKAAVTMVFWVGFPSDLSVMVLVSSQRYNAYSICYYLCSSHYVECARRFGLITLTGIWLWIFLYLVSVFSDLQFKVLCFVGVPLLYRSLLWCFGDMVYFPVLLPSMKLIAEHNWFRISIFGASVILASEQLHENGCGRGSLLRKVLEKQKVQNQYLRILRDTLMTRLV